MTRGPLLLSPGAVAVARALNALFFLSVAVFATLSYSPFAYEQFLKPNVVPELTDFKLLSPWLYWLTTFVTLLTLLPHLRAPRRRPLAVLYTVVSVAVGLWIAYRPPLVVMGNSSSALVIAILSPVWVVALAIHDLTSAPSPTVRSASVGRLFRAAALGAVVSWCSYAALLPVRLHQTAGIELSTRQVLASAGASLMTALFVFTLIAVALLAALRLARFAGGSGAAEYRVLLGLFGASVALVVYRLVCASIAFTGWAAVVESAVLGAMCAAVWAGIGRLRAGQAERAAVDAIELMAAPIAGLGQGFSAAVILSATLLLGSVLTASTAQVDWNFVLQKLGVLVVWLIAFAAAAALPTQPPALKERSLVVAVAAVVGAFAGLTFATRSRTTAAVLDQFAALDPPYRLVRDIRSAPPGETAAFYAFLRAHTLLAPAQLRPRPFVFARGMSPRSGRRPHIFLFVVDSLRRDYLGVYNPRVRFTPAIDDLARDSFVFDRAFTHYSGTGLSIPSLWAGGMVAHAVKQPDFAGRNALLELLEANGYVRVMDMDNIVSELMPDDPHRVQLDRGKTAMQFDICTTVGELEKTVSAARTPVFFYALPQNVHISIVLRQKPTPDPVYAGFFAPVAASVRRVDGCIGEFVAYLKRTKLYDDSIVILTADHGDSLGEGGRWGHPFFIVPEVMRIPLIVHLPSWMRDGVVADLSAVSFLTDVTPSLYALFGAQPDYRGPLFGRSLFVARDADFMLPRREAYLVGSSYAAVYGILRDNGTRLYTLDPVNNGESLFDINADGLSRPLAVTAAVAAANRSAIRGQLGMLSSEYGYTVDR